MLRQAFRIANIRICLEPHESPLSVLAQYLQKRGLGSSRIGLEKRFSLLAMSMNWNPRCPMSFWPTQTQSSIEPRLSRPWKNRPYASSPPESRKRRFCPRSSQPGLAFLKRNWQTIWLHGFYGPGPLPFGAPWQQGPTRPSIIRLHRPNP